MSEHEEIRLRPLRECSIEQQCRVARMVVMRNRAELEAIHTRHSLGMLNPETYQGALQAFIERLSVEIEHGKHVKLILGKKQPSILKRSVDYRTIKRHVTRIANDERVNAEAMQRSVGVSTNELYCSDRTLRDTLKRAEKNQEYLSTKGFLLDDGQTMVTLAEIAKGKELRRFSELYHINKNLEAMAQERALSSYFVTLTAPPNFHPNPSKGKNSYDQERLRAAHEAIDKGWKLTRARMSKSGVKFCTDVFFGIRFVEAHKDGCAHWHLLIYARAEAFAIFERHVRTYFPRRTQYDGKIINPEIASAASYTFKYMSKAVDSSKTSHQAHTEGARKEERSDSDLSELTHVDRVNAALKSQRIRQFQLFGVQNSMTRYRYLNKISTKLNDIQCETAKKVLKDCRFNDGSSFNNDPAHEKNLSGLKSLLEHHSDKIEFIKENYTNRFDEPTTRIRGIRIHDFEYHFPEREILNIRKPTRESKIRDWIRDGYENDNLLLCLLTGDQFRPDYADHLEQLGIALIADLGLPYPNNYADRVLNFIERREFMKSFNYSCRPRE